MPPKPQPSFGHESIFYNLPSDKELCPELMRFNKDHHAIRCLSATHFLFTVPGLHDEIIPATLIQDFNVTLIFAEGMPAYVPAYYNNFAQHMNNHDNSGLGWAYLEECEFASRLVYPDTLLPADPASFCINDHEIMDNYLAPGMVAVSSFYYKNTEEELRRSVRWVRQRAEKKRGKKLGHALLNTKEAKAKFAIDGSVNLRLTPLTSLASTLRSKPNHPTAI
ncbi:hypothetical protein B0H14DRAFT_3716359 [Mycena olivaceomarginata]|nr:hypothetical protein B0H14DRAFT_3716359 [Mycena olivaceomarginata]